MAQSDKDIDDVLALIGTQSSGYGALIDKYAVTAADGLPFVPPESAAVLQQDFARLITDAIFATREGVSRRDQMAESGAIGRALLAIWADPPRRDALIQAVIRLTAFHSQTATALEGRPDKLN